MQIYMDGKPVRVTDPKEGDPLTAIIVTSAPPVGLTKKNVLASLDAAEAEAAAALAEAPDEAPAAAPAAAAAETPAWAAEAPPEAAATPTVAATEEATPTEEPKDRRLLWIGLIVIIAIVAFLLMRKRKTEA